MNEVRLQILLVVVLAGVSAASAAGEGPGFYGGGAVGLSLYDDEEDDIRDIFLANGFIADVNTDVSDFGWKIFGGYRFNPYFGAEVAYVDLGEESADISLGPLLGSISATSAVSGVSIAGTAGYPVIPQAYVYAKLGAFIWDSSVDTGGGLGPLATAIGAVGSGDNGVDLTFGIGATYELVEHVKVRAEWERFQGFFAMLE